MGLPREITALINQAESVLSEDSNHDLAPRFRWSLKALILEAGQDGWRSDHAGYKAWLQIEILAVKKVLPIWEQGRRADNTPHNLLSEAEKFFDGTLDVENAEAMAFHFPEDTGTGSSIEYVLGGAIAALVFAIAASATPESLRRANWKTSLANRDLEFPHGWDAALCASVAYSGDNSLCAFFGRGKRLEFWKWWLEEAITRGFERFVSVSD
jgi:immunity protein Imm5 of predicted polymorphic toxin system